MIGWLIRRGIFAIPKSVRKERMAENFDVFDFELDVDDLAATVTLDQKASSFLITVIPDVSDTSRTE